MSDPLFIILISCAGLFVAGMAALFTWGLIRKVREGNRAQDDAARLGFQPIQPDARLTEQIRALLGSPKLQAFTLRRVYILRSPAGDLYLMDVETQGRDAYNRPRATEMPRVFVLAQTGASLPTLSIYPRVQGESALSQFANQMFASLLSAGLPSLAMSGPPEFTARCQVSASDAAAAMAYLNGRRAVQLSRFENVLIKTGGQLALVMRPPLPAPQPLDEWCREAQAVLEVLVFS